MTEVLSPPRTKDADREVRIVREFDAPQSLVFRAWTDATQLPQWFAPTGCAIRFRTLDIRPGGEFHSCIRTPDGQECWCKGVYREVTSPERIVFTMAISNDAGELIGPLAAGMDPAWPQETIVTVTFEEREGRTKLILHQTVSETLAEKTGAYPSWLDMLGRLEGLLKKSFPN